MPTVCVCVLICDAGEVLYFTTRYLYLYQRSRFRSPGPKIPLRTAPLSAHCICTDHRAPHVCSPTLLCADYLTCALSLLYFLQDVSLTSDRCCVSPRPPPRGSPCLLSHSGPVTMCRDSRGWRRRRETELYFSNE